MQFIKLFFNLPTDNKLKITDVLRNANYLNILLVTFYMLFIIYDTYHIYDNTMKYKDAHALITKIQAYEINYLNYMHEFSDRITIADEESISQHNQLSIDIQKSRNDIKQHLINSKHPISITAQIDDLINTVDAAVNSTKKPVIMQYRLFFSTTEKKYTTPIINKTKSIISTINSSITNDLSFEKLVFKILTLIFFQVTITILLLHITTKFINRHVLNPIALISQTIKHITKYGYILTHNQPSSYLITELSSLQEDLNNLVLKHADLNRVKHQYDLLVQREGSIPAFAHNTINPLSSIKAIVEHVKYNFPLTPPLLSELDAINQNVDMLLSWLTNILFAYRPTQIVQKDARLSNILNKAITASAYPLKKRKTSIEAQLIPESVIIQTDEDLMTQAISCILINAANACINKKKHINVNFTETDKHYLLSISDTGNGFSDAFLMSKKTITTKPTGNGIGLVFATKLVNMHVPPIELIFDNIKDQNDSVLGAIVTFRFNKT